MKEGLIRVERFEELRAGMIVVCKGCSWCGSSHRALLLRYTVEPYLVAGGGERTGPAWDYADATSCGALGVTPHAVNRGAVYRVDDGLEADSLTRSTKQPRKLERQR